MNHNQRVPTLISLAVTALRASGGLGDVRVLRVLARDRPALVGGPDASSLPLVGEMRGLVEVSLSAVDIDAVPDALAGLAPTLAALDLSCNRLTDLPPWMSQMSALRVLNLLSNQFETMPVCFVGMHQLARLDMSNNVLDAIPEWFGHAMGSLRQLHLCDAFARGPRLPASFAALTSLRHLSLCCSPTLGEAFDSWDDPGATPMAHPLWEPIYALTNLHSLVLHSASVNSVDERIGRLSRLTSIQGLTCHQKYMGPEWAKLVGLVDMESSYIAAAVLAHEFYALVRAMPEDKRPCLAPWSRGETPRSLAPKWFVPCLVDLCLMAVSVPVSCAPSATSGHAERTSRRDSHSSRVLYVDGGGHFTEGHDYGLYGVDRNGNKHNADDDMDGNVYIEPVSWCVDRGNDDDNRCGIDTGRNATDHPLAPHTRALLPVELSERATVASLRICALCKRRIIGQPSRIDTAIVDQRDLLSRYGPNQRMAVERALCLRCASTADTYAA